jgi:hypothetical protein
MASPNNVFQSNVAQGGWSICAGTRVVTTWSFGLGDRVVFSFDDLVGMVWSHVDIVSTIAQSVQRYAEGVGIVFRPSEPAVMSRRGCHRALSHQRRRD